MNSNNNKLLSNYAVDAFSVWLFIDSLGNNSGSSSFWKPNRTLYVSYHAWDAAGGLQNDPFVPPGIEVYLYQLLRPAEELNFLI